MNAEIISIGDELLIGQVINTNQAVIAEYLNAIGISATLMTTVGDSETAILKAFEDAWGRSDAVLVTGGLGPTHDDITRSVVCRFFDSRLVRNEEALEFIRKLFEGRGIPLTRLNEDQALIPHNCSMIRNLQGTAPGYLFERDGKYMIVMPGVPYEMKGMMEDTVIPFFSSKVKGSVIRHRTLKTTGIAESLLAEKIGPVEELFPANSGTSLAYLPSPTGVRLRITVKSSTQAEADKRIADVERLLVAKAGKYIYGSGTQELEEVIGMMLVERGLTLSVAESCTGGLIASKITDIPGSSRYFLEGRITYTNESKIANLGVPRDLFPNVGAVSKEVAEAMAEGVRGKTGSDIGLSTTGVAGPDGGTAEKPVGLVWIAYADSEHTIALRFNFGADRKRTKERASQAALELLRRNLLRIS
jgi:competence/damage-inducible protein CinA-like protein